MNTAKTTWGLLLLLALNGCSSLRLPRIDPSGDRLFLPADAAPAAASSGPFSNCDFSSWTPQFKRPDRPLPDSLLTGPVNGVPIGRPPQHGPCGATTPADGGCFSQVKPGGGWGYALQDKIRHHLHKNGCETVTPRGVPGAVCLSPQKLVAPVGREVVLVSGMCGDDGYLITEQPMEWMLSKESVGHFVDVGEPAPSSYFQRRVKCREGQKLGVDYAITKTTKKQQMITRGTPSTKDDILLQRGQTWVSLMSHSEGTSHVTTLATDGDRWDQRRRTATIHWVDADVAFPPSQQLEAGQRAELVTTVVRASDRIPARGYIVRYTIQDSISARFVPGDGQQQAQATNDGLTLEVATDANGEAVAFVATPPGVPANDALISIEVIRPARGAAPELPVFHSSATIRWATASLQIQCDPDRTIVEGGVASFQFTISNPGNLTARNVVASIQVPAEAFDFQNSSPAPSRRTGINYEYAFGNLEPGGARTVVMTVLARQGGAGAGVNVRLNATAVGEPNLQAKTLGCNCQIIEPGVRIFIEPQQAGPIEVGQQATYTVSVSNVSTQQLTNVTVTPEFPPQMRERQGVTSGIGRLINASGVLNPNETAQFNVIYEATGPGTFTHYIRVASAQGQNATAQAVLEAVAPAVREPVVDVRIQMQGPEQVALGGNGEYQIFITNEGDTAIEEVQVAFRYPNAMPPIKASEGHVPIADANELRWRLAQLNPGDRLALQVQCVANQLDPQAAFESVVLGQVANTRAPLEKSATQVTAIVNGVQPPGQPGAQPGGAQPGGQPGGAQPGGAGAPPAARPQPGRGVNTLGVEVRPFEQTVRVGTRANYTITLENLLGQVDSDVIISIVLPNGMTEPRFNVNGNVRTSANVFTLPTVEGLRARERLAPIQFSAIPNQAGTMTVRVEVDSRNSQSPVVREVTTRVTP